MPDNIYSMSPKKLDIPPLPLCWLKEVNKLMWVELESWGPPKHEHGEWKKEEWGL